MKTIVKGNTRVQSVWGRQKPKDREYRLMKYLVRTECGDGILLHNVVTGQMVLLSPEEEAALQRLPSRPDSILQELVEAHFLVPVESNDEKSVEQLRRIVQISGSKKGIDSYTILPTTACNARCFYCYESNFRHVNMTEETAEQVIEFIASHCGKDSGVSLGWFGGEPTLGVRRIDQICRGLSERGIEYTSRMISNGYLLSGELGAHAKELWHLRRVQITLDGTEAVYNKTKAYVYPEGSPYRKVLDNITQLTAQEIRVVIRMNMDRYNCDDLRNLIDELAERFRDNKYLSAYVHVLFDDEGFDPVRHTARDRAELEKLEIGLNRRIREKGLQPGKAGLPSLRNNSCMADSERSLVITPSGDFSRCEHLIEEGLVGSLAAGEPDRDALAGWKVYRTFPECRDCVLKPSCLYLDQCADLRECSEVRAADKIRNCQDSMRDSYARWLAKKAEEQEKAAEPENPDGPEDEEADSSEDPENDAAAAEDPDC